MKKNKFRAALFIAGLILSASLSASEIHEAVRTGDLRKVRALVEKDAGLINVKDENGRTPLHWATRGTDNEVLTYLIEKGADLNALDSNGTAPLHSLASRGNADGIRILLAKGADIEIKSSNKSTPLHFAVLGKRVEIIRLLVERKADLESRDEQGRTPLVVAAREMAGPDVVRALLDLGANIDSVDRFGDTALSLATWRGSADVVSLLLERNVSLPLNNPKGRQILESAASTGLADLFTKMAEKGADLNLEIGDGRTLLHAAAEGGSVPILEILLGKGLDINQRDAYGWVPLHFVADMGRTAAMELLLSRGADAKVRTAIGQSAFNLAEDNEDKDTMKFLVAKGCDQSPARFPELAGEYLGQKKPGKTAEVFAPGIVSGRFGLHSNVVFSPDGKEAFWSMMIPPRTVGYGGGRTVVSRLVDGRWTYPREAVFTGMKLEDVPFFHSGGILLFDMARRPFPGGQNTGKENIWVWEKRGGEWTDPRPLEASVNDLPHHWQFSVDREGCVYFSTNIPGSLGGSDIYVSRLVDGRYQKPENLGAAVNTQAGEGFPFIAPDGRYLLFGRNMDIYVSFREEDGKWGEAKRLGPEVNTSGMEILPIVSPDGQDLFFSRNQQSYWIDAAVIEDAKPKRQESHGGASRETIDRMRDRDLQPEKIMDVIQLRPGMIVGEAGAGYGYFTFKMSRRVGNTGIVYANDIDADALGTLEENCRSEKITNIKTVLGAVDDPLYPRNDLDMVVVFDCLFEFSQPAAWMRNARKYLKPEGKLVIVDPDPSKIGSSEHFLSRQKIRDFAREAGYTVIEVDDSFLKSHMIVVLHGEISPPPARPRCRSIT